jgi:hypothetical protein
MLFVTALKITTSGAPDDFFVFDSTSLDLSSGVRKNSAIGVDLDTMALASNANMTWENAVRNSGGKSPKIRITSDSTFNDAKPKNTRQNLWSNLKLGLLTIFGVTSSSVPTSEQVEAAALKQYGQILVDMLTREQFRDGYFHSADQFIDEVGAINPDFVSKILENVFAENAENAPEIAAGVLRCIGHLDNHQVGEWGIILAISGLKHTDYEIQEAAIKALESWETNEARQALQVFIESANSNSWLKAYSQQVLENW